MWLFNYFTSKVTSFSVEMENSASELVDYFIKQRSKAASRLSTLSLLGVSPDLRRSIAMGNASRRTASTTRRSM